MKVRAREHKEPEIPMASLPDIAFLLIVFFLLTATFRASEGIQLPQTAAKEDPNAVMKNPRVELQEVKGSEEQGTKDTTRILLTTEERPETVKNLEHLSDRLKLALTGKTAEERAVILKSGDEVPYDLWAKVVDEIGEADARVVIEEVKKR